MTTLKEAKSLGYTEAKPYQYGGEAITVKGRQLVREPKCALSRTEWLRKGYVVLPGQEPHAILHSHKYKLDYAVFREDQVRPKRKVVERPPVEVPVTAALFTVNRYAKRCRDAASASYDADAHGFARTWKERKQHAYFLKSHVLQHLWLEGKVTRIGYHRFGDNWAEVLGIDGYRFHRPCSAPPDAVEWIQIDDIDAKPRGSNEPRVKDAFFTLEKYLSGRAKIDVFEWQPRTKSRRDDECPDEEYPDLDSDYESDCLGL